MDKTEGENGYRVKAYNITPIALNKKIDKESDEWRNLKTNLDKAREIRNKITHEGRKASKKDVDQVFKAINTWLEYLGYIVDIDLSVIQLKWYIEENKTIIVSEEVIRALVQQFFQETQAYKERTKMIGTVFSVAGPVADLMLQFGGKSVGIEFKIFSGNSDDFEKMKSKWLTQLRKILIHFKLNRIILIVISNTDLSNSYEDFTDIKNEHISMIIVYKLTS